MAGKFSSPNEPNKRPANRRDTFDSNYTKPQKEREPMWPKLLGTLLVLVVIAAISLVSLNIYNDRYFGDTTLNAPGTDATENGGVLDIFRPKETTEETTEPTEETKPEPHHVIATATISATGDALMHMPVVNSFYEAGTNTYDFVPMFEYYGPYIAEADYAVTNLETTLAGLDNGYQYSGYPCFNCPDEIVTSLSEVGFDMLLTANNHCYDTSTVGLLRTQEKVQELGMEKLGTRANTDEPTYMIKDINGIKVGMLCYTYSTRTDAGALAINGLPVKQDAYGLINNFNPADPGPFYTEVEQTIATMESEGAEAIVMYIHWGIEYQLFANEQQRPMAQKLCDLGVDVIVGNHPHVVQPMDLLTSTVDENHKTVCLYSTGNAISNQRRHLMNLNDGHTEDGILFTFSFSKYSDGTVVLEHVELLPTWINLYQDAGGANIYRIIPLDKDVEDWETAFNVSGKTLEHCEASYQRTMELVGPGLEKVTTYLTNAKADREAMYLDMVNNPDAYTTPTEVTEATETTETTEVTE